MCLQKRFFINCCSIILLLFSVASFSSVQAKPNRKKSSSLVKEMRAKLTQGKKLLEEGEYEEALALFQEGYQTYQESDFLQFTGYALLKLRRYKDAQGIFEEFLLKNPRSKQRKEIKSLIEDIPLILDTGLLVTSTPSDATIWLDTQVEAPLGTSPFEGQVMPGPHILIVQKPGYSVLYQRFVATQGERTEVKVSLEEAPSPLLLTTEPTGANVFLDGEFIGKTPYQGEVSPGSHLVEAKLEGYSTLSIPVEARLGEELQFSKPLPPPTGLLVLSQSLSNAKVFVDDELIGTLPLREKVAIGEQIISIKAPGYREFQTKILIETDQEYSPVLDLKPQGFYLTVKSAQNDFAVKINGKLQEKQNENEIFLSKGNKYKLKIYKKGFLPFTQKINVDDDKDLTLQIDLRKNRPARALPVLAVGIVAGAIGTVCGLGALESNRQFQETPSFELKDQAERQALCADISLGASALAAIGSIALLRGWGKRSSGELLPMFSPNSSGLGLKLNLSF